MIMLIGANSGNINFIYFTSLQWTIKNQGLDAVMNYGRESFSSQLQNPSIIEKEAVDLKFAICNLPSRDPYRSSKSVNIDIRIHAQSVLPSLVCPSFKLNIVQDKICKALSIKQETE